ncbi:hypothetical protein AB0J83_43040 [Actinoplanes sp. NPDC049596]|uniref:hypothetical protein n=1 Tax=unclassified Actinoplanes TaxID=2626549 RepID=UPI0034447972
MSYSALDRDAIERNTQAVADQATCRTVDSAIVAYVSLNGAEPTSIASLAPFAKGDISAYRIVEGQAAGPGCMP